MRPCPWRHLVEYLESDEADSVFTVEGASDVSEWAANSLSQLVDNAIMSDDTTRVQTDAFIRWIRSGPIYHRLLGAYLTDRKSAESE